MWQPRHGLICAGALVLALFWLFQCLGLLAEIRHVWQTGVPLAVGWFGLLFATVIFGVGGWHYIWEVRESWRE